MSKYNTVTRLREATPTENKRQADKPRNRRKEMKMKSMNEYKVDQIAGTITITKKFAKAAGVLGSVEYNIMKQLRTDNPTFTVLMREIKKKEGKKSYRNLTYENMRTFIATMEGEDSDRLFEFDRVLACSKSQSAPYAYVKKWFLSIYKDEFKSEEEVA